MSLRHTLSGVLAILSWGTLGLMGAMSSSMPPHFVLMCCFAIAAFLGLIVVWGARLPRPVLFNRTSLVHALLLSAYHLAYLEAFHHAEAIPVSLINYLWPACLILLGNMFFELKSGPAGYLGVVLGFGGITVLMNGISIQTQSSQLIGYALALIGALIWATFSNLRRRNKVKPIGNMAVICLLSAMFCGIWWAGTDTTIPNLTFTDGFVIVALGLGPAGGAFYLWDLGMRHGNAVLLGVLGYSAPVISTLLMFAVGVGAFSWNILVALALITMGGFVVHFSGRLSRSETN